MRDVVEIKDVLKVLNKQLSIKELGLGERVLLNGWKTALEWVLE